MKTGTTSLQIAARNRRKKLLSRGVRYPGGRINQRRPLGALMGWSVDPWKRSGPLVPNLLDAETISAPPRREWDKLASEMNADSWRRMLISHEYVSQVDDVTARHIVDEIGDPIHVCISLRAPGQILPSLWSQGIRDDALTDSFGEWLSRVYGTDPDRRMPDRFFRAYDQGELVERWARLVGPENVTVIIADKSDPALLTGSFEAMLGLPVGVLHRKMSNRSLTAVETELFRQVNADLRSKGGDWRTFHKLIRQGALKLGVQTRGVAPEESRVLLPPWAAELADKDGRRFADSIQTSQVRVVGDLEKLAKESPSAEWHDIDTVPVPIAAQGIVGAVSAAQQSEDDLRRKVTTQTAKLAKLQDQQEREKSKTLRDHARTVKPNRRAPQLAAAFTTRELAAAIKHRLRNKLRSRTDPRHR